jgi:tRNA threonylcarbamoyl adenosine modification protein (Sua5/YciO/YrdC/YwlC family)
MHPLNPQHRLVTQAVAVLREGGLIAYPTDSCYAFGCCMDAKEGVARIERIRRTDKHHNFTLVCRDLSEIATYARVEDWAYRLLRAHTPGPYTFILPATRDVPRRLQNPKRRTIGIRVPDHPVPRALLAELGEPLMSSTLLLPGDDLPITDPDEICERLDGAVDLVIDGGNCGVEPTSVVDLTAGYPQVLRRGRGNVARFA